MKYVKPMVEVAIKVVIHVIKEHQIKSIGIKFIIEVIIWQKILWR